MDAEILEKVAAMLADGLGDSDNLDVLERRLTRDLQQLGHRALQKKLEGKKGATGAAGLTASAGKEPGLSPTGHGPS